ncbi:unnamed protein product, partial [marine sediment metagenome]
MLPSDGSAGDIFGRSVSIDGDYVVIGANLDDDNGKDSGAAYIFKRSGSTWIQEAKLLASDGRASDRFGFSVSINGTTAIIGADLNDNKGENSGAAYIFRLSGSRWVQED